MTRAALQRWALAPLLLVVLPLAGYFSLLAWMRDHGGATVMLGASSGSPAAALVVAGLALLLRVYTVVALPGLLVVWGVARAWDRVRRRNPG
jgi:hypothetical protein